MNQSFLRYLGTGFLFAVLWASASSAGKIGLQSAEGLVLFVVRFLVAGVLLLGYSTFVQQDRFPKKEEWLPLTIFGLFNTTLYLGIFIISLEEVTAGITSISLALNPLLISTMTALWLKRPVTKIEWISILIGIAGVVVASYPLLLHSYATPTGLVLLALCMVAYSFGSVYYATIPWKLSRTAINGWQVLMGGILLIPFAFLFHAKPNHFDLRFWLSIGWLVVPVSIGAVQLWLYLLKADAVKASIWLFLCPIFGLVYATILLNEPFNSYTVIGTVLVLIALLLGQQQNLRKPS
ncbi:MAG TPA: EamA family transporter [Cyclobacteriaceae bacterium]|nr:EamA family transporter [Cyclobacteriaceae bacterium]